MDVKLINKLIKIIEEDLKNEEYSTNFKSDLYTVLKTIENSQLVVDILSNLVEYKKKETEFLTLNNDASVSNEIKEKQRLILNGITLYYLRNLIVSRMINTIYKNDIILFNKKNENYYLVLKSLFEENNINNKEVIIK